MPSLRQQVGVGPGDRRGEGVSLDDPSVYRHVQVAAGREAHREWADEAPENRVLQRDEAPGERETVHLGYALPQVGGRGEYQRAPSIRAEREPHVRTAQGERL